MAAVLDRQAESGPVVLGSVLSSRAIMRHIDQGNVVIDPFNPDQLKTSSYDVRLGEWYFEPQPIRNALHIYNPHNEAEVRRTWGDPIQAPFARDIAEWGDPEELLGARPDERVILLPPETQLLGHTLEFIGGRNCVTTMMHARSSMGRNFVEVCSDAGWGDVGYVNRWTLELRNKTRDRYIPLVVGRRVAQLIFFEVEPPLRDEDYGETGKYQTALDIEEIKRRWKPEDMLPKLWKDPEARGLKTRAPLEVRLIGKEIIVNGRLNGH